MLNIYSIRINGVGDRAPTIRFRFGKADQRSRDTLGEFYSIEPMSALA